MKTEIDKFVENQSAETVIASFDVHFDIPFRHDYAVGLLQMLGAFERPKREAGAESALAAYVGASWCRIVSADVRYRLLDGIEAINGSSEEAERLEKTVLARGAVEAMGQPDAEEEFQAYAVARWLDGAGKIKYRAGNHTEGRMLFGRAMEVCKMAKLWWCEPDINSNFLRSQFEELRIIEEKKEVFELLARSVSAAESQCIQRSIPEFPIKTDVETLAHLGVREREFLRGFSSLLHNFSVTAVKMKSDTAKGYSKRSEAICVANGDEYRASQAVLFQAQQMDALNGSSLFKKLLNGKWRRGRLIARQNLAKNGGIDDVVLRIGHLSAIFDEIAADSTARGGQTGLDLDFHAYTVTALKDILQDTGAMASASVTQSLKKQWDELFEKQETIMIQSLRRVVVIASYKQKFSKSVRPIFLKRIERAMKQEELEHAFSLAEESSARELLDLMSASQQESMPATSHQSTAVAGTATAAGENLLAESGIRVRRGALRKLDPKKIEEIRPVMEQRRETFEAVFLNRQITSVPHDPDVAYRTRMFVASEHGACLIRYFGYGAVDKKGLPTKLGAFVFRGREMKMVPGLELDAVQRVCDSYLKKDCPTPEDCRVLWDAVIEPLRHLIVDQSERDGSESWPRNLVIIPSDALFHTPLHVALDPKTEMPLGAIVPLCFSVSATAHINRGRHLYRSQVVEDEDDLCAMIVPDIQVDPKTGQKKSVIGGSEVEGVSWPEEHFHVAGLKPAGVVGQPQVVGARADLDAFLKLMEVQPEFFVFAGHGYYDEELVDLGAALGLEADPEGVEDYLTQFDLLMRVRLRHNKLTMLNACVAGHGADAGGGEVAGFVRALIGAGAGAIGITLWSVDDQEIGPATRHLLKEALSASRKSEGLFNCVDSLRNYYQSRCNELTDAQDRIEACPVALYL